MKDCRWVSIGGYCMLAWHKDCNNEVECSNEEKCKSYEANEELK